MSNNPRRLALYGIGLGLLFWLFDTAVDVSLFDQDETYFTELFEPEPIELYMRVFVLSLCTIFGFYAAFLLDRANQIEVKLRSSNNELKFLKLEMQQLSELDPLTGTFNRRKFHEALDVAISKATRYHHRFSLLMMDIDHFKRINDTFGHQSGDQVLYKFCELIKESSRNTDQLFRMGGEEFALITSVVEGENIQALAEKLRKRIESFSFPKIGHITMSIGIANIVEDDDHESIYARADNAMYEAKRNGRNCIVSSDDLVKISSV